MTTPNRRISITASDYNQKMDKIIAKGTNVPDTLIALLNEANKYHIEDNLGKVRHGQKVSKTSKRVRK